MRYLQQSIMLTGALVLGSVWGLTAVGLAAITCLPHGRGERWGGGPAVTAMVFCGLPLGATAGIANALRIGQRETEEWSATVWIGVALAAAPGLASSYFVRSAPPWISWQNVLIAAIGTATYGTIGGLLAAIGEGTWRRTQTRSHFVAILFTTAVPSLLFVPTALMFAGRLTLYQTAWLILIGVPILYGLPTWLERDWKKPRPATVKAPGKEKASVRARTCDEPGPGERATAAVARVRALIDTGDVAGALATYDKETRRLVGWPEQPDLHALIKAFHARGAEADSLPLMRDHCRYFPAESSRVRLKLAQVLIRDCGRPGAALKVLDEAPAVALPAELETVRQKLTRQAARMREEGVSEREGDH